MNKSEEMPIKSVSIRIPVDVLEELHRVAKQHDRSLNGEVLSAIRDHLKKSRKEQGKA
jgi:predicted transcriptional regulator